MMTILGLDASTEYCSVSLQHRGQPFFKSSRQLRAHAEVLLPMVDALLSEAQLDIHQLDAIACSAGPGSFTGLRIAFGVAQGLAYGANKPLLMADSLAVLAETAVLTAAVPENAYRLCILDARMDEVYWSLFDANNKVLIPTQLSLPEQALQTLRERPKLDAPLVVLGNGAPLFPLNDATEIEVVDIVSDLSPRADALVQIAEKRLNLGEKPKVEEASLNYLRNSVSWNKRKRIRPVEQ